MQNLRSMLQKHLRSCMSTGGATYARFIFALPFAAFYVAGLTVVPGFSLPEPGPAFLGYTLLGGLAQILATALLVYFFSFRNFAVGTTYSKTETVQTALFGLILLGDMPSLFAALAILVCLVGVVALSADRSNVGVARPVGAFTERTALIGLASGGLFGVSAVSYRAAALSLDGPGFVMQAAFTLVCVLLFQTVVMAVYLACREPGQLREVMRAWRGAGWVGICGMLASDGWFTAMTLQNAAYVRALGQIELVFTFAAAQLFFRERTSHLELAGIVLIVVGILVLLLGR